MADEIVTDVATGEDAHEPQTFTADYVKALREEAKANRLKWQSLLTEKEQREAEAEAAKAKLLEEQGEYKTLAEQRAAEIERLKAYEAQVQNYTSQAEASNAAFIEQVPEERRGLIPSGYPPLDLQSYLQNNRDLLIGQPATPHTPPSTNGGAGTYKRPGTGAKPLTTEEMEIARKMGISAEDYQLSKANIRKEK
jgi:vacuolar-type H+-ATPase subunit I/STV1